MEKHPFGNEKRENFRENLNFPSKLYLRTELFSEKKIKIL